MPIDIVTGAAVGAVAGELLKAILDAKDKAVGFEYYLERLEATLESIISQAEELQRLNDELSRPRSEIGRLLERLEEGKELVCKCSNIPCWAYYNKFLYTKKILKLDDYLHRFFNMDLRVAEARDVKKTLKEVLALRCHFKSFSKRRRANRKQSNTPSSSSTKKKTKSKKKQKQKEAVKVGGAPEFSYRELMVATDSFSIENIVGEDSYGKQYAGRLADGQKVEVKRFIIANDNEGTPYGISSYETELETLSRLHHKHLVRLFGFCDELEDEKLLVCEYMEHGNLFDHLHSKSKETKMGKHDSLLNSWHMRVKISTEAAKGIEYLQKYAMPPIIHRDIKPKNILLDSSWTAKVSGLCLSVRLDEPDERPVTGTMGYIDSEYLSTSTVSAKGDVFSLGVVLLELLTGRRAIDFRNEEFPLLIDHAVPVIMAGKFREILDSRVMELQEPNEEDAVELLAHTAMRCVASKRRKRPYITEVVADLEKALAFLEIPRSGGSVCCSEDGELFDEIAMRRQRSSASSSGKEFSFTDLAAATSNFSFKNTIGSGIFRIMYRGILANGREVAVERGKAVAKMKEIEQEDIASKEDWELSVIQHVHLGRELGYCEEAGERLSVYEYMRNGTLYDQLHNVEKQSGFLNSWNTRIRIPLDVAREIKDLHIHCDIRSSNILLDSDLTPSVSQYGLLPTNNNDVYGFGVLLLELLTGKPALREDDSEVKPVSVVNYAQPAILAGDLGKVLDGRVGMPEWREAEGVELMAKTALQCVNLKAAESPSMTDIITDLERALGLCDNYRTMSISNNSCYSGLSDGTVLSPEKSTGTSISVKPADGAEFRFVELATATGQFSAKSQIGSGSFGIVYKGILADGKEVAIKRNHEGNKMKRGDSIAFEAELVFLRIQHNNLVRLFGFCQEQDEKLLVYEYMRNGSLHDHLHNIRTEGSPLDSWRRRMAISLDVAKGIEYLHNYAISPIVHGDIKSMNILLDANWNARLSDFGLSFMASQQNDSRLMKAGGTSGYLDPDNNRPNMITVKSDVYGFGVVLLELLTGKRAIFKDGGENGWTPVNVVDYAVPAINAGELGKVLDERVSKPELNEGEAVELLAYTAMRCVNLEGKDRPNMTDVVANLERAFAICNNDSHGSISSVAEITVVSE